MDEHSKNESENLAYIQMTKDSLKLKHEKLNSILVDIENEKSKFEMQKVSHILHANMHEDNANQVKREIDYLKKVLEMLIMD